MPIHDHRKVLTIFIGSPDDVLPERQALLSAKDEINNTLRTIGWTVDLGDWSNVLPGKGRPQELINESIRKCQLFIGVLHKRWGTPTGKKKYSSGFEEEFELANSLMKKNGVPNIWMFFKKVSEKERKSPDEHLQKIFSFREKIAARKNLLCDKFLNLEEWKKRIPLMLIRYVIELDQNLKETVAETSDSTPTKPKLSRDEKRKEEVKKKKEKNEPIPKDLQTVLNTAMQKATRLDEITNIDAARLHLFSTAAVPEHFNLHLDNHITNLLYLQRNSLDLTARERKILHITLIVDPADHIPGWFWFPKDNKNTNRHLLGMAMFSKNEAVRRRATELLSKAAIPLEIQGVPHEHLIVILVLDSSDELIPVKFNYLAQVGNLEDIPILDQFITDSKAVISDNALNARSRIMARQDPNRILNEIVEKRQRFFVELGQELEKQKERLDTKLLIAATQHADKDLRAFAGRQLATRNAVTDDLAKRFIADESSELKMIGQKKLLQSGLLTPKEIKDDLSSELHPLQIEILSRNPVDVLLGKIDWISIDGMNAYEALAEHHFEKFEDRLHADLSDNFKSMRVAALKHVQEKYGSRAADILKDYVEGEDIDRFIHDSLLVIALNAIAKHGKPKDVSFGRRYLNAEKSEARIAAIKIVERFGDVSDCGQLIQLTKAGSSLRRPAARAILKLSERSNSALRTLLGSEDPLLVDTALSAIKKSDLRNFIQILKELLLHKSDSIRLLAVACLHRLAGRDKLEEILDEYIKNKTYYYNVVAWLDRVVYAPPLLKKHFEKELHQPFASWYE